MTLEQKLKEIEDKARAASVITPFERFEDEYFHYFHRRKIELDFENLITPQLVINLLSIINLQRKCLVAADTALGKAWDEMPGWNSNLETVDFVLNEALAFNPFEEEK